MYPLIGTGGYAYFFIKKKEKNEKEKRTLKATIGKHVKLSYVITESLQVIFPLNSSDLTLCPGPLSTGCSFPPHLYSCPYQLLFLIVS